MKKTKFLNKNFLNTIRVLIILAIILLPNTSHAVLQANPNTQYIKTQDANTWMTSIREMEASGGAMGLSETFKSDYTSKTSNNIDVHMMRTTEYGAMAILSASGYGNPSNEKAITTTTGNNTGVIKRNEYWEFTAGTSSTFATNQRYWDKYKNDDGATSKIGDALVECKRWHSTAGCSWVNSIDPVFIRGQDGVFAFMSSSGGTFCRGVAVCGEGL